jgi:hypothetical protein
VLEPAGLPRHLQLLLRPAPLDRFGRIEHRKMLAENLRRGIARQPLGAAVPRDDVTFAVEQVDGVVLDALHELPVRVGEAQRMGRFFIAHAESNIVD